MITNILASVDVGELTDGQLDEIIGGAGDTVSEAVGEKISRLFDGLVNDMGFALSLIHI